MFFAPVFQTSDVRKCSIVMIWKARRNNEKVRISDHAFLPIKFLFFFFVFYLIQLTLSLVFGLLPSAQVFFLPVLIELVTCWNLF